MPEALTGPGFDPRAQPVVEHFGQPLNRLPDFVWQTELWRRLFTRLSRHHGDQSEQALQNALGPSLEQPSGLLKPAAVLVGLQARDQGWQLILTRRTAHLRRHAGQIAFPGGRTDPGDPSPEATALREAHEEVGLPTSAVQLLGRLPQYATITGYQVTPVVAFVDPHVSWSRQLDEVAEVFTLPAAQLLDPTQHQLHRAMTSSGHIRHYWSVTCDDRFIWGATAAMIRLLCHQLQQLTDLRSALQDSSSCH